MTQQELELLPTVNNVVLWQPDDNEPTSVIDVDGNAWMIGLYQGKLCKSNHGGR
jgi:hypothetical protein